MHEEIPLHLLARASNQEVPVPRLITDPLHFRPWANLLDLEEIRSAELGRSKESESNRLYHTRRAIPIPVYGR